MTSKRNTAYGAIKSYGIRKGQTLHMRRKELTPISLVVWRFLLANPNCDHGLAGPKPCQIC